MNQVSLEFESPDLASWLWLAVGVLVVLEALRYVVAGHRPASWGVRLGWVGILAVAVAAMAIGGQIRLAGVRHVWAVAGLGLLAVPWLVRTYRRTTRPVGRTVRFVLVAIRLTATGVILLLLAGPVLQSIEVRRERAVLGIALDDSRSMTVRDVIRPGKGDEGAPTSRTSAVLDMLQANRSALHWLGEGLDVRWFAFDTAVHETVSPMVDADVLVGQGEWTRLAGSVDDTYAVLSQQGSKVAGMIVVSDGRDTSAAELDLGTVADSVAQAGVPIYAVGVGNELPMGQTRSLQSRRLVVPERVSVQNQLGVEAEFFAAGLADHPIDVEFLFDDKIVDRKSVRPAQVRELLRFELAHVPSDGGLHRITVRARAQDVPAEQGEAFMSQFVRVTDDKIRVLYLDRGRYERAAIARALESSKELNVTKIDAHQPPDETGAPTVPRDADALRIYHVVLIGDVDRSVFTGDVLQALHDFVIEDGHGLAMLGGLRTIGSGKYRDTPLDKLLPVDLSVVDHMEGSVAFTLTPAGKLHPICQLAEEMSASETIWPQLPPFVGASRLTRLSPAAEALIQSEAGAPLLVVQETGEGRTAVAAFDSTWQWPFAIDEGLESQRRFWRQLVLWLANRRPEVWVTSDKPQYDLARLQSGSQEVIVRAGVTEPTTGKIPENVAITGKLVGPGEQETAISWVNQVEGVEAKLSIEQTGEYHVRVEARFGNQPADAKAIGQSETAFVVESVDREMVNPLADLETLRRLAGRTGRVGGRYVLMAEFGDLLEQIRAAEPVTEIRRVHRRSLTDEHPWWWIGAFVVLLTVEWIVRRRAGLV